MTQSPPMETGPFSKVSPKEKRRRILICGIIVIVAALICVGIMKLGKPFAKMESDLWAWKRGRISSPAIQAELDQFIRADNDIRQVWAAKKLISLGVPGSEPIIVSVLTDHMGRQREVAALLLNCGNADLSEAARRWASEHGYQVETKRGGPKAVWGR